MRKTFLLFAAALALGPLGCGNGTGGPVTATPEMEAEQKQAEQDARNAESANRKNQRPERTFDQNVEAAESARQRR